MSQSAIPRPPTPPGWPSTTQASQNQHKDSSVGHPNNNHQGTGTSQSLAKSYNTFSGPSYQSNPFDSSFANKNFNQFPAAGQIRNDDGKAVQKSEFKLSSEIHEDGVQHQQGWMFKMQGESGRTSENKEWFVSSDRNNNSNRSS